MDARSQQIHDMIQLFPLDAAESPEITTNRLLDIMTAINERMDAIESAICTDTDKDFRRLQAIDAMPQVIDPEKLIAELRGIYDALPDNADVSGRALRDLLERLDQTNTGETNEH